jgi:hypothetical protein
MSALFLKKFSRIWRFGNSDDFDSVKQAFSKVGAKHDLFPIEVHGKVLEDHELIEEVNIADGELILFEFRIVFNDPPTQKSWAFAPLEKKPA